MVVCFQIVPELQRELMEAQRQSANQANDNLQLQEHCTMLERRQREYEKKMRQFQSKWMVTRGTWVRGLEKPPPFLPRTTI